MGIALMVNEQVGSRLRKYYGLCIMDTGREAYLEVKAASEVAATTLLHAMHNVKVVVHLSKSRPVVNETPAAPTQKYHADCIRNDGTRVHLVVRASSALDANLKLHKQYKILMVEDIRTAAETAVIRDRQRTQNICAGVPHLIY